MDSLRERGVHDATVSEVDCNNDEIYRLRKISLPYNFPLRLQTLSIYKIIMSKDVSRNIFSMLFQVFVLVNFMWS